jgi:hypothetical protein
LIEYFLIGFWVLIGAGYQAKPCGSGAFHWETIGGKPAGVDLLPVIFARLVGGWLGCCLLG